MIPQTHAHDRGRRSRTRTGLPKAVAPDGRSRVTTLPAPITASSPIFIPRKTIVAPPIQTLRPMVMGCLNSRPQRRCAHREYDRPCMPVLIIDGEKDSRRASGDGARLTERLTRAGATVIRSTRAPARIRRCAVAPTRTFLTFSDQSETESRAVLVELLHGVQRIGAVIARKFGPGGFHQGRQHPLWLRQDANRHRLPMVRSCRPPCS